MAYDKRWYLAFLDLQDYKNTYGNYKIPKDYYGERSEINLYEWYQKQRQYFKKRYNCVPIKIHLQEFPWWRSG